MVYGLIYTSSLEGRHIFFKDSFARILTFFDEKLAEFVKKLYFHEKRVYDLRKSVYRLLIISSEGPWAQGPGPWAHGTGTLGLWDRDLGTRGNIVIHAIRIIT